MTAFVLLLVAGAFCLTVCWAADHLGRLFGVMDRPDGQRKVHRRETPLVGGIAIIAPVVTVLVVLAAATPFTWLYATVAAATVTLFIIGFVDDKRHIPAALRLSFSFAVCFAAILAVPALSVAFLEFDFLPFALFLNDGAALAFSLLCLVGLQNAINMADGRNGLVIGMALIWVILLFAYAPVYLYAVLGTLSVVLAITLVFNTQDRLFLGDSGSYALSILVGLLAIYCYQINGGIFTADAVALMFLVPVIDCLRLVVLRVADGRSPFSPDNRHLHHVLERLMPWDRGLVVYLSLVALPNVLALVLPRQTLLWAILTLVVYATLLVVGRRINMAQRQTA